MNEIALMSTVTCIHMYECVNISVLPADNPDWIADKFDCGLFDALNICFVFIFYIYST